MTLLQFKFAKRGVFIIEKFKTTFYSYDQFISVQRFEDHIVICFDGTDQSNKSLNTVQCGGLNCTVDLYNRLVQSWMNYQN